MQQQIRVRKGALHEIIEYINSLHLDVMVDNNDGLHIMSALFQRINNVIKGQSENEDIDQLNLEFKVFINENFLDYTNESDLLPVPVFSYIKPTLSVQFIYHIMLSMGCFATEIDLIMHLSLRESLRYAKLIGPSNDPSDLQDYSNKLLYHYIEEQLQYFPNSKRV